MFSPAYLSRAQGSGWSFGWMAVTGTLRAVFLTPGRKATGLLHFPKEMHELGLWLLLACRIIPGRGVIPPALAGENRWRQMFFWAR